MVYFRSVLSGAVKINQNNNITVYLYSKENKDSFKAKCSSATSALESLLNLIAIPNLYLIPANRDLSGPIPRPQENAPPGFLTI